MDQFTSQNYLFSIPEFKSFSTEMKLALAGIVHFKSYTKGTIFIKEKEPCTSICYILSGLVRAFYETDGNREHIWAFFGEGAFCTCPRGIMGRHLSHTNFQAMEDIEMLYVNQSDLDALRIKYPEISVKAYEILSELMYHYMDEKNRLIAMSGEERYIYFVERYAKLVNRLPIGQISQFLGIHHASLSRIRSKISKLNGTSTNAVH